MLGMGNYRRAEGLAGGAPRKAGGVLCPGIGGRLGLGCRIVKTRRSRTGDRQREGEKIKKAAGALQCNKWWWFVLSSAKQLPVGLDKSKCKRKGWQRAMRIAQLCWKTILPLPPLPVPSCCSFTLLEQRVCAPSGLSLQPHAVSAISLHPFAKQRKLTKGGGELWVGLLGSGWSDCRVLSQHRFPSSPTSGFAAGCVTAELAIAGQELLLVVLCYHGVTNPLHASPKLE